jgi:hypothetical protein
MVHHPPVFRSLPNGSKANRKNREQKFCEKNYENTPECKSVEEKFSKQNSKEKLHEVFWKRTL